MEDTKLLIKQAKKGNKESLIKLIMLKQDEYYKLAYVYLKNKDDALDALQDMIIILYENISRLKKDDSFYSWSKTILVNSCKNKLNKNKRLLPMDDIEEEAIEVYGDSEERISLEKYLQMLSEKQQEVIKLRYFLDMNYETISEVLKIPIGTVKSRLNNAMKNLKDILGGEYVND